MIFKTSYDTQLYYLNNHVKQAVYKYDLVSHYVMNQYYIKLYDSIYADFNYSFVMLKSRPKTVSILSKIKDNLRQIGHITTWYQ